MKVGRRVALFVALVLVCAIAGTVYVLDARGESPHKARAGTPAIPADASRLGTIMAEPHVVLTNTGFGPDYGKVQVAATSEPNGPRALTDLECARVATGGGKGICLTIDQGIVTTYTGKIFDEAFEVEREFPLPGRPSRARMSPDGHYAAMTVFVFGDSYAANNFSTRTLIVNADTGESLGHLEEFTVTEDGKTVDAINRNYWGVTFAEDSNMFYATLAVGDDIDLIQGDVSSRSARVIEDDIECPSLSPDGTRLAYKYRVGGGLETVGWRVHVMNLETGADIELVETRSVDDQVEWLDDETVLYALPSESGGSGYDTWAVAADGTGEPVLVLEGASSPSVTRADA